MKTLLDCKEREVAILHSFSPNANHDFIHDLMDYGLLPGTQLILYPNFSFSDKIIVKVGDSLVSIRKQDAINIFIQEIKPKEPNER